MCYFKTYAISVLKPFQVARGYLWERTVLFFVFEFWASKRKPISLIFGDKNTVELAPLMDTVVSGQLYLRPHSQNPDLLNSHSNSVFSHSPKRPAQLRILFRAPRVSAYESFKFYKALNFKANKIHDEQI